ncbi:MAG: LacI family DNA-binding transcriptional regulator [Kiritimatiellae bacterium]|nr:LacI family DNA-binding transcriptional regulator [Kiritimatiellia bacterium]
MTEIAALAGVSQSAVSLVLNDRWRAKRLSRAIADRVIKIARERNYRPNRLIHALRTGRTHTVAAIFYTVRGEYYPQIAAGIEEEAKRHGYHLLISQVMRGIEEEAGEIEVLLERRVDGLILVPRYPVANRDNYRRLIAQGIPLVCVDSYFPDVPCPAVVGADEEGMHAATTHLIELGHRRIAYAGMAPLDATHMKDRYNGFLKAMTGHGLEIPADFKVLDSVTAVAKFLRRPGRPTAFMADNDYGALNAIRAAESLGLRVPDDLAVAGFSDCLANEDVYRVPLTSVHVDLMAMGRLAMQHFLREVEHVSGRHELTRLPASLVVRASSAGKRSALVHRGHGQASRK